MQTSRQRSQIFQALFILAFFLPVASRPLTAAVPGKPNILLITVDTLRADHLGCYGDTSIRTPAID
ncbi:sulfatase, partial [bacterium]